ncbi:MAG: phosphosulfolactate synthase [Myxococcales bacterium]|nr:phosphosulfolactate synthase [Myxococcales bacterium]MCB9749543.1 phosphosulfolactate synthase [Myxococcales bacterium]
MDKPTPPQAFAAIQVPELPPKPRTRGLTSILDKGLGPASVEDLCRVAGEWIDVVKLGWGTARIHPREVLKAKIDAYHLGGALVCTGGTFMEVAYAQNRVDALLEEARALGIDMVEVSNGVHPMTEDEKRALIRQARAAGFTVWSEVGRKDPEEDALLTLRERLEAIEAELEAGAERVILEARESGRVGIYNSAGEPQAEMVKRLVDRVGVERLLFEAPMKSQQVWLLRHLGPLVNLGNIAPADAIPLATLRMGLRGDTLAEIHLGGIDVHLETGFNGAVRARERGGVVVMIDALRASATMIAALASGMRSIRPVATVAACQGGPDEITAGERGGRKLPHVQHGNSPTELLQQRYVGKSLVITSSNGVECLMTAAGPETTVLVGTTLNREAVARAALELAQTRGVPITLLMAGRNNRLTLEDSLAAGLILRAEAARGVQLRVHGATPHSSATLEADFLASESGKNLVQLGYGEDVRFCAGVDRYELVPVLEGDRIVPLSR